MPEARDEYLVRPPFAGGFRPEGREAMTALGNHILNIILGQEVAGPGGEPERRGGLLSALAAGGGVLGGLKKADRALRPARAFKEGANFADEAKALLQGLGVRGRAPAEAAAKETAPLASRWLGGQKALPPSSRVPAAVETAAGAQGPQREFVGFGPEAMEELRSALERTSRRYAVARRFGEGGKATEKTLGNEDIKQTILEGATEGLSKYGQTPEVPVLGRLVYSPVQHALRKLMVDQSTVPIGPWVRDLRAAMNKIEAPLLARLGAETPWGTRGRARHEDLIVKGDLAGPRLADSFMSKLLKKKGYEVSPEGVSAARVSGMREIAMDSPLQSDAVRRLANFLSSLGGKSERTFSKNVNLETGALADDELSQIMGKLEQAIVHLTPKEYQLLNKVHGLDRETTPQTLEAIGQTMGRHKSNISRSLDAIYRRLAPIIRSAVEEKELPAETLKAPITRPKRQPPGSPPRGME